MKNFVDEYSVDYRNLVDFVGAKEKIVDNDLNCSKDIVKKECRSIFRKLIASVLLFVSVIVTAYEILRRKESPTVLNSVCLDDNVRRYDDLVFPVVMQDPKPFDRVEDADVVMLVSASLWNVVLSKKIDKFDDNGLGVVDEADMWKSYENLFGKGFRPNFSDSLETNFFKFDSSENKFHIKPCSNQSCYIPYTENCTSEGGLLSLKVGYVSPNDSWRSLKSDKPERPNPVKFVEYKLARDKGTGSVYIKTVKNISSE